MTAREAGNWLPVSALEIGFNENKLPSTAELAGKEINLFFQNKAAIKYHFRDARSLVWEATCGTERPVPRDESYEAIKIEQGLYFVDYVKQREPRKSVSASLNFNTRQALVINCTVPSRREAGRSLIERMGGGLDLSPMKVEILKAGIDVSPSEAAPLKRSLDLIGKRVRYTYSRLHTYEHIYLNHRFYCWHCLEGPEKGTADTDSCDYYKIARDIYLFIWREKIVPTVGIVMINFKKMRSDGKIFGLDLPSGRAINFTIGSKAKIISETS